MSLERASALLQMAFVVLAFGALATALTMIASCKECS